MTIKTSKQNHCESTRCVKYLARFVGPINTTHVFWGHVVRVMLKYISMKFNDRESLSKDNTGTRQVNVRVALNGVDLKIECFLWFVLQEILQIHFNKKFWGSEHQRISSSVFVKCDDGAEEMLQPSILVLFCSPGNYVSLIFLTCLTSFFQTSFVHPFWKFKG